MDWLDNLYAVKSVNGQIGDVEVVAQEYAELTISDLSGTYNSLDVDGFNDATSITITAVAAGSATINGIKAPPNDANGLTKILYLPYNPAKPLTLTHNSGSAASGDKIIMATGASVLTSASASQDVYLLLTRVNGNWFATRLGSRVLTFGATSVVLSGSAPSTNQLLNYDGSTLSGINPGAVMARMTASNSSTQALTFSANQRLTWNGSATPSFTFSSGSAVDGATITIFFPASSISSITLSSDLDPTGTVVYAFDSASAAYRLTMQYLADGPSIVCSLRKVTDL